MNQFQYAEVYNLLKDDCTISGKYSSPYGTCAIGRLAQAVGYLIDDELQEKGIQDLQGLIPILLERFGLSENDLVFLQEANDNIEGFHDRPDPADVIEQRRMSVLDALDGLYDTF